MPAPSPLPPRGSTGAGYVQMQVTGEGAAGLARARHPLRLDAEITVQIDDLALDLFALPWRRPVCRHIRLFRGRHGRGSAARR